MRGDRPVHDVPKVRADLVGSAVLRRVACGAFLVHGLAGGRVGRCQQLGNRDFRGSFFRAALFGFGRFDEEAFFLGHRGGEDRIRDDADGEDDEHDSQKRADQLVEFERVHSPEAPLAGTPAEASFCTVGDMIFSLRPGRSIWPETRSFAWSLQHL